MIYLNFSCQILFHGDPMILYFTKDDKEGGEYPPECFVDGQGLISLQNFAITD